MDLSSCVQNEDDFDIYGDLTEDNEVRHIKERNITKPTSSDDALNDEALLYSELTSLQSEAKELRQFKADLIKENALLKASLDLKEKQVKVLKYNISSLYKTAKLELERRSQELADLRHEYDAVVFRRISQRTNHRDSGASASFEHNNLNQSLPNDYYMTNNNQINHNQIAADTSMVSSSDLVASNRHNLTSAKENENNLSHKRQHFEHKIETINSRIRPTKDDRDLNSAYDKSKGNNDKYEMSPDEKRKQPPFSLCQESNRAKLAKYDHHHSEPKPSRHDHRKAHMTLKGSSRSSYSRYNEPRYKDRHRRSRSRS